jgi:N-acetylmuramoyl-L-alanine amidase
MTAAVLLAPVLSPPHGAASPSGSARVSDIRAWTSEEYTRVAIDTGGEVSFQAGSLPADPSRNLPPRIFIDIRGAGIRQDILRTPVEVRNGLMKQVRAGRFSKDVVRVVIDLERASGYRAFALPDPFRIIVDVDGNSEPAAADAKAPAPGSSTEAPGPDLAREIARRVTEPAVVEAARADPAQASARRHRVRVMIDPGHGGKDSGAIGPTGLKEKDVVLAIGRMVREKLSRAGGYDVRMTRDGDVFIPLEERTAMANKGRADVFVSLHINASPNRRAEGISTYVLSRSADNREDLELAARENGVPVQKLSGVKFIIDDMFTGARKNESLRLAKTVNDSIVRNVSARYAGVQNLGLKQAPFFVLVGARMTAVLVESSFISNGREEARLRNPEYLERIADGVVDAVRFYGQNGILVRSEY